MKNLKDIRKNKKYTGVASPARLRVVRSPTTGPIVPSADASRCLDTKARITFTFVWKFYEPCHLVLSDQHSACQLCQAPPMKA